MRKAATKNTCSSLETASTQKRKPTTTPLIIADTCTTARHGTSTEYRQHKRIQKKRGMTLRWNHPALCYVEFLVQPVLYGISQVLKLSEQPCRQHRQSEGADEKGENQDDNAIHAIDREKDDCAENGEYRSRQPQQSGGYRQQERREMNEQNQQKHDRCKQDFQKDSHRIASFYKSMLRVIRRMNLEVSPDKRKEYKPKPYAKAEYP